MALSLVVPRLRLASALANPPPPSHIPLPLTLQYPCLPTPLALFAAEKTSLPRDGAGAAWDCGD